MPKSVYFPREWNQFVCWQWLLARNLPFDLIERDRGGYIWVNLQPGYSYAVYGEASR